MSIEQIIEFLFYVRATLGNLFLSWRGIIETASLLVSAALFSGIVYLLAKLNVVGIGIEKFADLVGHKDLSRRKSVKAWRQVERRMQIGDEAHIKLAVIEADKILDEILKMTGLTGETMADRLKKLTPAQLSNIEDVWQVHKARNRIVHEPDYHFTHAEADYAIGVYRAALKELGLID